MFRLEPDKRFSLPHQKTKDIHHKREEFGEKELKELNNKLEFVPDKKFGLV